MLRVDEEQVHFAFLRMNSGVTDDLSGRVDGDEQSIRRYVLLHELVPSLRRKHRLAGELAEICPPFANRRVEHGTNLLRISRNGASY
jgi:hypothetical protein